MEDRRLPDSESDNITFNVSRDPRKDKYFNRKQELLQNCKERLGKTGTGKQPMTIAVIGELGCGKSSFLNTVFAAFSNDHWVEYAKYGKFGIKDKHITTRLKIFRKEDYYKKNDDHLMPTFLDMKGFGDEDSDFQKVLLNIVFRGKLEENEDLYSIVNLKKVRGDDAVREKYFGRKYLGIFPEIQPQNSLSRLFNFLLIPNRHDFHRVNRIIVVCSANPISFVPQYLLQAISDVTRERDITLYGVLTQTDKDKPDSEGVIEKERTIMKILGIPKTRFARITNYCPDIDPTLTYEDTIVPSLDVPVLRLMRQVFTEEATDVLSETQKERNWKVILLIIIVGIISVCIAYYV